MTLTLEQRKAYALELTTNPLLGDILEDMESSVMTRWRGTAKQDTDAREQAWDDLQAIHRLRSAIESVLQRALEAENETEDEAL